MIVTQSIEIEAEPARVWAALTNSDAGPRWRGADFDTDWRVGAAFSVTAQIGAKSYRDKGVVVRADAPKVLEYLYWSRITGLPDEPASYSRVTIKLVPHGDHTVVEVEQDTPASPVRRGKDWEIGPESGWKHVQFYWRSTLPFLKRAVEEGQP